MHLLEYNNMWIRARGAWVEQTPTTNMCHSINRIAHHAGLLPIILYLEYFSFCAHQEPYARKNSIIFTRVNLVATI